MSLNVERLSFSYGAREVLNDVSFSAENGQFVSVLGPNGAGKSTLFRCMLGILKPSAGRVTVEGQPVSALSPAELARRVAYIPQSHDPAFPYSVLDMVLMGTTARLGRFSSPGAAQTARAESALERLDIAHLRDRGYAGLSGGERQLVLIARALAQQAKILVMDEPSASLDLGNKLRVMQTVRGLTRDGCAVIQSTHDPDQAFYYSDKILALREGRVLAWGTPRDVIQSGLISHLYGVEAEVCSLREDRVRVCLPCERKDSVL